MDNKKLWTRADIRAEMNRLVKGTTDACKIIHDANAKIEALGKESGFEDDATRAWGELRRRVFPPGVKAALRGDYSEPLPPLPAKVIPRIEDKQALREALRRTLAARGGNHLLLTPPPGEPRVW